MITFLKLVGGFILNLIGSALIKMLTERMVITMMFWCLSKLAKCTKSSVDDEFVATMKAEWDRTQNIGG